MVEKFDPFDTVTAAENATVMEVRAPATGEVMRFEDGRPWTITLLGKDSKAFTTLSGAQQDRRVASQMRTRSGVPSAVLEKDHIETLVVLTKSWEVGFPGLEESKPENFRVAYSKYPALREQVDDFTGVRSNFIKS